MPPRCSLLHCLALYYDNWSLSNRRVNSGCWRQYSVISFHLILQVFLADSAMFKSMSLRDDPVHRFLFLPRFISPVSLCSEYICCIYDSVFCAYGMALVVYWVTITCNTTQRRHVRASGSCTHHVVGENSAGCGLKSVAHHPKKSSSSKSKNRGICRP